MPFLFYIYGKKIRAKSKFSPSPDIAQDKRRDEEARLAADGESGSTTQGSDLEQAQEKETEAGNGGLKGDGRGMKKKGDKSHGKMGKEA